MPFVPDAVPRPRAVESPLLDPGRKADETLPAALSAEVRQQHTDLGVPCHLSVADVGKERPQRSLAPLLAAATLLKTLLLWMPRQQQPLSKLDAPEQDDAHH